MQIDPAGFAETHLGLLYVRDRRRRLVRSRDPDVRAPLVHLVRSAMGNCWCVSTSLDDALAGQLERALAAVPPLQDPAGPPASDALDAVRGLLSGVAPSITEDHGPIFAFPSYMSFLERQAEVLLDAASARTVPELSWISSASRDSRPICVIRNEDGEIVSVCHSSRSKRTAAEAGVETAPGYRRQGFAVRVVQAWADEVMASGRTPVYSTSWRNTASLATAARLDLLAVAEDWSVRAAL